MPPPSSHLLIIGTVPPPIGGVTVHTQRLLARLGQSGQRFSFFDAKRSPRAKLLGALRRATVVHLQLSNAKAIFGLVLLCRALGKTTIFTLHGDVRRFAHADRRLTAASLRCASVPVVLNQASFDFATRLNRQTLLLTAFVPPGEVESLPEPLARTLDALRSRHERLFCTNAYNRTFDKAGREIYQIGELVALFTHRLAEHGLLVSDPSGAYGRHFAQSGVRVGPNVRILSEPHDFNAVLQRTDGFLRYTTTDGDSLSVREAMYFQRPVIATDVVDRPEGVHLVPLSIDELERTLRSGFPRGAPTCPAQPDAAEALLRLYAKHASRESGGKSPGADRNR